MPTAVSNTILFTPILSDLKGPSTRCSDVIRSAAEVSWPSPAVSPAAELCQADSNKTLREVSGEVVKCV
ncbi:hypothetical protein R3I94_019504 [Phoxinus phoxinus]|uniref:Uncharacterized protein n=1 Tax=Phoxinus phoxinus TaxID=58324 RepID=A0AAN9CHL8_9TELE